MFTLNSGKLGKYLLCLTIFVVLLSVPLDFVEASFVSWLFGANEVAKDMLIGLSSAFLTFFGYFLQLAGFLMNFAIKITVENMSFFVKNSGVESAWTIIRDVVNIGFIFGIVYIAISTILRISGKGIKELLGKLIMAAILINFSFFFTGIIIDASNILTLTLYKEILKKDARAGEFNSAGGGTAAVVTPTSPTSGIDIINRGISGIFMDHLKVTSLFDVEGEFVDPTKDPTQKLETGNKKLETGNIVILSLFASIFILILTFLFLVVALLLFTRLIILVILMVLSPMAYLGWVFPGMKDSSDKWWNALWEQVFFAPIYMLMTLVIITIISDPGYKAAMNGVFPVDASISSPLDVANFSSAIIGGFKNNAIVVVNYIVIMGLAIASVGIAVQTSAKSGGVIAATATKTKGWVAGGLGRTGRQTLGRAGSFVAGNEWLQEKQRSGGKWGRATAGLALRAGEKVEGGSFDIRGAYGGEYLGAGKAPKDRDRRSVRKKWAKKRAERVMKRGTLTDEEMAKPEVKERWEASPEYEKAMKKTKELEKQYENATQAEKYDVAEEQEEEKEKLEDKMRVQMEKFKKNDPRRQYAKEIYALPGEKGYGTTGWNMGRVKRFLAKKSKRFLFTDRKRRDARRETDKLVNRTTEGSQIYDAVRDATADSQAGSS